MSELVCSLLEGRVRLSRAGRAHRLEQAPLHVHQKPSTSLEGLFRSGDKRKKQPGGRHELGAGRDRKAGAELQSSMG